MPFGSRQHVTRHEEREDGEAKFVVARGDDLLAQVEDGVGRGLDLGFLGRCGHAVGVVGGLER